MNDYIKREELARITAGAGRSDGAAELLRSLLEACPPLIYVSEASAGEVCQIYQVRQQHVGLRNIPTLGLEDFVEAVCDQTGRLHICTLSTTTGTLSSRWIRTLRGCSLSLPWQRADGVSAYYGRDWVVVSGAPS